MPTVRLRTVLSDNRCGKDDAEAWRIAWGWGSDSPKREENSAAACRLPGRVVYWILRVFKKQRTTAWQPTAGLRGDSNPIRRSETGSKWFNIVNCTDSGWRARPFCDVFMAAAGLGTCHKSSAVGKTKSTRDTWNEAQQTVSRQLANRSARRIKTTSNGHRSCRRLCFLKVRECCLRLQFARLFNYKVMSVVTWREAVVAE